MTKEYMLGLLITNITGMFNDINIIIISDSSLCKDHGRLTHY
jgi:hypothetical protein